MDTFRILSKVLCASMVITILLLLARITHALYFSPLCQVPGPAICKVTSLYLKYFDARLLRNEMVYEWHQKYGSVILIAPGEVSFSSAPVAREIYSAAARYPKSSYFDYLAMYGFRSIFMAREPAEHQRLRKRTFRCYQPTNIYRPSTIEFVRSLAKSVKNQMRTDVQPDGATINVHFRCNSYSFDNITRFALGPYLCSNAMSEAPEARSMFQGWEDCEVWAPLGFNFPIFLSLVKFFVRHVRNEKGFLTGEERLKQWTSAQLALAVDEPGKSGEESLLRQLLEVKTKEHVSLPIDEIAEEILDNFFAAQSVVTNALTFLLWDLACHPGWQSKVRRELQSLPAQDDGLPSFADIDAASILDACLRESSRIHPLSSGRAERVVPTTKAYDQVIVPAGVSSLMLCISFLLGLLVNDSFQGTC